MSAEHRLTTVRGPGRLPHSECWTQTGSSQGGVFPVLMELNTAVISLIHCKILVKSESLSYSSHSCFGTERLPKVFLL